MGQGYAEVGQGYAETLPTARHTRNLGWDYSVLFNIRCRHECRNMAPPLKLSKVLGQSEHYIYLGNLDSEEQRLRQTLFGCGTRHSPEVSCRWWGMWVEAGAGAVCTQRDGLGFLFARKLLWWSNEYQIVTWYQIVSCL